MIRDLKCGVAVAQDPAFGPHLFISRLRTPSSARARRPAHARDRRFYGEEDVCNMYDATIVRRATRKR